MLLSLITSLFVLLSAAAPVAEDRALSPTLTKRSTECAWTLGYSINQNDCYEAFGNMQTLPQFNPGLGEGIVSGPRSQFSRTAIDRRFRLPQSYSVRTCTICVDLSRDLNALVITRPNVLNGVQRLINQCVHNHYIGGVDNQSGIYSVIGNEQNMSPQLRPAWAQCKLLMSNNPFNQQAQCLLPDGVGEAAAAAAVGWRHGTSKR